MIDKQQGTYLKSNNGLTLASRVFRIFINYFLPMKTKATANKKKVEGEFSSLKTKKQKRDAFIKLIANIIVRVTFDECYGKENELEKSEN